MLLRIVFGRRKGRKMSVNVMMTTRAREVRRGMLGLVIRGNEVERR
jgi:hypothetical protein